MNAQAARLRIDQRLNSFPPNSESTPSVIVRAFRKNEGKTLLFAFNGETGMDDAVSPLSRKKSGLPVKESSFGLRVNQ